MLNRMQQIGLDRAKKWWLDGNEQLFKIAGYAGTGKTYLSGRIADELANDNIAYCAFTGKAALVMQQRGMPATTIHQLIYNTESKLVPYDDNGVTRYKQKLVTELKERLDPKPSIILVDVSIHAPARGATFESLLLYLGDLNYPLQKWPFHLHIPLYIDPCSYTSLYKSSKSTS